MQSCLRIRLVTSTVPFFLIDTDHEYPGSFKMWCWRRMEISWTNRLRNEEVCKESAAVRTQQTENSELYISRTTVSVLQNALWHEDACSGNEETARTLHKAVLCPGYGLDDRTNLLSILRGVCILSS